jgi:hypothetical protein
VQSREVVRQLNARCVDFVRESAGRADTQCDKAITENRELWLALHADRVAGIATLPFVIVDAQFADFSWWEASVRGDVLPHDENATKPASESSMELMDEVAMFAWQVVRWDRTTAQLSLGMTPAVADIISSLGPQQMRAISKAGALGLRLRWHNDTRFWRELLTAAIHSETKALSLLSLHAKLRLCSELARL